MEHNHVIWASIIDRLPCNRLFSLAEQGVVALHMKSSGYIEVIWNVCHHEQHNQYWPNL